MKNCRLLPLREGVERKGVVEYDEVIVPPAQSEQSDQAVVVFWMESKTVAVLGTTGSSEEGVDPVPVEPPELPVEPVAPVVVPDPVVPVLPDGEFEGVPVEVDVLLDGVTSEDVTGFEPPQATITVRNEISASEDARRRILLPWAPEESSWSLGVAQSE